MFYGIHFSLFDSKKGRTGYCPATIIRRVSQQTNESTPSAESITYESEKSIYEGLNIHKKPPPRRYGERD